MRASQEALNKLWWATLAHFIDRFENPPKEGLRASFVSVAVKFLNDNGITTPGSDEDGMDRNTALAAKLKELRADNPQ